MQSKTTNKNHFFELKSQSIKLVNMAELPCLRAFSLHITAISAVENAHLQPKNHTINNTISWHDERDFFLKDRIRARK